MVLLSFVSSFSCETLGSFFFLFASPCRVPADWQPFWGEALQVDKGIYWLYSNSISIFCSLLIFSIYSVYMCVHMRRSKHSLQDSVLSFILVGSGDQTQSSGLTAATLMAAVRVSAVLLRYT